MNHERRQIMEMKKKQFNNPENIKQCLLNTAGHPVAFDIPENMKISTKISSIRTNVQINRIRKFKNVAAKSIWYEDLLKELI